MGAVWGAAAVGAGALSYPSIRDFLARRRTVKHKIESHPAVKEKEVFWFKSKKGQLREVGKNGRETDTYSELPRVGDRSSLHTHPFSLTGKPGLDHLRRILMSNSSPQDMYAAIDFAATSTARTAHVAVMNEHSKVVGYYSYRFSKKLLADSAKINGMREKFIVYIRKMNELKKENQDASQEKARLDSLALTFQEYLHYLEACKKEGLLIHRTPAPGYTYQQAHFRPK